MANTVAACIELNSTKGIAAQYYTTVLSILHIIKTTELDRECVSCGGQTENRFANLLYCCESKCD